MSAKVVIDISEVEAVFQSLNQKQLRAVLNPAIRKVMNPVLHDAQINFRMDFNSRTGNAYKSLGISPYRKTIGLGVGARIRGENKGWYARFLNDGTAERFRKTKKGLVSTGRIIGKPFFTDAVKSNEPMVMENLEVNVIKTIERMIKKSK